MSSFVKTLHKKASRPFLRQPQAEGTGGDRDPSASAAGAAPPPVPSLPFAIGNDNASTGGNPPNPASSSMSSRLFKRKTYIPPPPPLSVQDCPKPILRREVSPPVNAGTVKFPTPQHLRRRSTLSVASASSKASSGASSNHTATQGRSPPGAYRQAPLPVVHSHQGRAPSPVGSVRSTGSHASSTVSRAHVYQTQAPAAVNSAAYDALTAAGNHAYNSDRRRSMYRSSPPSSPRSAARETARNARRSSRTPSLASSDTSSLPTQVQSQVQQAPPRRPGSSLGHASRGRRSSRPSTGSSSRTRDSITSLSGLSYDGRSPTPSTVLEPASPILSAAQLPTASSLVPDIAPVVPPSPVLPFHRLSIAAPMALAAIPQSPDTKPPSTPTLGLITPPRGADPLLSPSLASTPGGACPWSTSPYLTPSLSMTPGGHLDSSTRRRTLCYNPGDGSPLPLFKVIPATPGRHSTNLMLKDTPEAEVESRASDEKPHARVLDFGEPDWKPTTVTNKGLEEPISLKDGSFRMTAAEIGDKEETKADSGASTPTRTATPIVTKLVEANTAPVTPPRNPARLVKMPAAPAPPKPAKNPRRSLYNHYDDGRSISQSLAELATIACDLPPFGAEMTMAAAMAAARLAAARASTDSPKNSPQVPRVARGPPSAPPLMPPPPIPANVAPFSVGGGRGWATPPPTVPRNAPVFSPPTFMSMSPCDTLPPSPDLDTYYPSLPSLVLSREGTIPNFSHERFSSSRQSSSTVSLASTLSDNEEGMVTMIRQLSTRSNSLTLSAEDSIACPSTPKAHPSDLNVGYGTFDFSAPGESGMSPPLVTKMKLGSPMRAGCTPTFNKELALPDSPPLRIHRMSAAAANPNRTAFYGAANFLMRNGSTASLDSGCPSPHSRTHSQSTSSSASESVPRSMHMSKDSYSSLASQASLSSMGSIDFGSDYGEDEVLTANVVALNPYMPAKYVVRRERASGQDVGVAF